jgi:hypothetical protein
MIELEWLLVGALLALLMRMAVGLVREQFAYERFRSEFHNVMVESGIETVYAANAFPPKEVENYEKMRAKLAERHTDASSLKVGHIAFRKGKPCRITKVDYSTETATEAASLTVEMLEDKQVVGTEAEFLRTPVALAGEVYGAGPENFYVMTEQVPWARFLPDNEKMLLRKALMQRTSSVIGLMMQLQNDKGGLRTLWSQKRVSDAYYQRMLDLERMLQEELNAAQEEAELLDPGSSKTLTQSAVNEARKKAEMSEEMKEKQQIQEAKENEEKKAEEDAVRKKKEQEEEAERMARELIEQEEASEKKKKKKAAAGKK